MTARQGASRIEEHFGMPAFWADLVARFNLQIVYAFGSRAQEVAAWPGPQWPLPASASDIDAVEALPFEDRQDLLEILQVRMAEDRREQIAANAAETLVAVRENRARFGDLEDLKKDLLDNPRWGNGLSGNKANLAVLAVTAKKEGNRHASKHRHSRRVLKGNQAA